MTTARRGVRLLAGALLTAVVLAGCTKEDPPTYSGTAPAQWAGSVCDTLTPWRSTIADLNAQAQEQLATSKTPQQTRDNLLTLLTGAQTATEQTRASLVATGPPAVERGAEIAARFAASLEGARDAYAHAVTAVNALSLTDEKAFYDGLVAIFNTLNEEYSRTGVDTSGLESRELREAFAQAEKCR